MAGGLAGLKVLVVEDDPELGWLTRTLLEEEGATVQVALSGRDAIEAIDTFDPELALVDARLPDMTGGTFSKILQKRRQSCVQVLVSGDVAEVARWSGFGKHAVSKPYDVDEFLGVLHKAVSYPTALA